MSSNKIVLTSSGGESFEVDKAVAREFQTVAHMIDNDCADKPIPLTNVSSKDLALVIEYCKTHVEAGVSLEEEDKDDANKQVVEADVSVEGEEEMKAKKTMLKAWDAEFMKEQDLEKMFQLILAAKYLNVQGLVHLVCQKVADHLQDKTPEEVRKIFSIENDYTPEEEAAVRKENSWAFR